MSKIISHIDYPHRISEKDIREYDDLLIKFPFFQTAHLILTKGLLNIDSVRYNRQLRKVAAFSIDRKSLFKLITQNNPKQKKSSEKIKQKIGNPLEFNSEEKHSFSEWLTLSKMKKIERVAKTEHTDLIKKFIDKKLSVSEPKKENFFKATDVARESLIENYELVTPTLAKVYLEQGHYKKAISAYEKLSLKYPEKKSLFAKQIKLINNLKEK